MRTAPLPSTASMPAWARETEARLLTGKPSPADRFWADPTRLMADAGMPPDPWQANLLRTPCQRMLLLCSRQAGKSQTAAALALQAALLEPSLVLLLSPTQRQSAELFRDKMMRLFNAVGRPVGVAQETALTLTLANGSRVVALPGNEEGIRGFSGVTLLVIDEASRVPDDLYRSVRPMLSVSRGRLVALSTPFGRRGWFFDEWTGTNAWERVRITAEACPRISREFLAEERAALGDRWFRQEYLCEFEAALGSPFDPDDIDAALTHGVAPLFGGEPC